MTAAQAVPAATAEPAGLERLVGERTVPQLWHENYWFRRHEIAYLELALLLKEALGDDSDKDDNHSDSAVEGDVVVEAGCGEGYGAQLLHRAGVTRVVALDYDAESLRHASLTYPEEIRGRAARTNLAHLPLASGSSAAVVSLQVIEHLWTPWEFLDECARILRPGGLLIVTTPNRPTFSPGLGRGEKPPNPFHVREFDAAELAATIAAHLHVRQVLGVRHGSAISAWEDTHGSLVDAQLADPAHEWAGALREMVGSITAADFVIEEMDAEDPRLLDLVVIAQKRRESE